MGVKGYSVKGIGEKIKRLRKRLYGSQAALAKAAGVEQGVVSNWEKGKNFPHEDTRPRLAKALKVGMDFFDVEPDPAPKSEVLDAIERLEGLIHSHHVQMLARACEAKQVLAPLYPNVAAGVSVGEPAQATEPLDFIPVHESLLNRDAKTFGVRVSGDSMLPAVEDGDLLLCSPQLTSWKSGDLVIAITSDGEFVKRIKKSRGKLELVSDNPEYGSITVSEYEDIRIVKVVKLIREY